MPEYICVKCFSCGAFQSQQRNKAAKFSCPICSSKQAVLKLYAISDKAKDIRLRVQTLNAARLQQLELGEEEHSGDEDQVRAPPQRPAGQASDQLAPDWAEYLDDDGSADIGQDADTDNALVYNTTSSRHGNQDRYITSLDQPAGCLGKVSRKRSMSTGQGDTPHARVMESHHKPTPFRNHTTLPPDQQPKHQCNPSTRQHQNVTPSQAFRQAAGTHVFIRSPSLVAVQPLAAIHQTATLIGNSSHQPWKQSSTTCDMNSPPGLTYTAQQSYDHSNRTQHPQHHILTSQHHSVSHPQSSVPSQQQQQHWHESSEGINHTQLAMDSQQYTSRSQHQHQQHHLLQQQQSDDCKQPANGQGSWQDVENTNPHPTFDSMYSKYGAQLTASKQAQQPDSAAIPGKMVNTSKSSVWDSFAEDEDEEVDGAGVGGEGGLDDDQSCRGGYAGGRLMTVL